VDSTTVPPSSALFPNNTMLMNRKTLALVAVLADPLRRRDAARELALHIGATDLILFILDSEINIFLPAPGFPQTLPHGSLWHAFLAETVKVGQCTATLPFPDATTTQVATGISTGEHVVLVLLGVDVLSEEVAVISTLLPLLEAAFRGEQATLVARATTAIAHKATEEAKSLTVALDGVRGELVRTLAETDTIIESMPDAVFVYDSSGHIVRVNAGGASMLGVAVEQARNIFTFTSLYYPDGSPVPPQEYAYVHALHGRTRTDIRCMLKRLDTGKTMHLLVSAAPIRTVVSEITGAVVIATDITELTRLERQKEDFLGIASHELRTPLTALKGLTQLTHRKLLQAGLPEARSLELMEQAIARMERLIKDFLDISRIEENRLTLRLERCNLQDLCLQTIEEQRAGSNRQIHLQVPDEPVEVEIDADRLRQVLINLLSNALKYSSRESPVTLTLSVEADQAVISVHDEGVGIPPDALPHLFERFYRVAGTNIQSGSEDGFGLGLYICKTIITLHHGQIGVQSLPGQGSTFWFKLPLCVDLFDIECA
jgi:PAS domain S-box-containing protein